MSAHRGVGDAKAHRRSVRARRFRRCLEAASLGHFRGHPSEQNLLLERAARCSELMGQDPGEQRNEDGRILPRHRFEEFGTADLVERHHDGVANRLGLVARAWLPAAARRLKELPFGRPLIESFYPLPPSPISLLMRP
jgi:hypothetical protein